MTGDNLVVEVERDFLGRVWTEEDPDGRDVWAIEGKADGRPFVAYRTDPVTVSWMDEDDTAAPGDPVVRAVVQHFEAGP